MGVKHLIYATSINVPPLLSPLKDSPGALMFAWMLGSCIHLCIQLDGLLSGTAASNFLNCKIALKPVIPACCCSLHESQHASPPCPSPTPGVTRAQLVKNALAMQETPVQFLGQEDLLEKE